MTKLKKNIFYSIGITILNLIYPLLTYPYISRKLGVSNFGRVDFTLSYMNYFLMLSSFGVIVYGMREISKVKNDKVKTKKVFYEIFIINLLATLFFLGVYFLIILRYDILSKNKSLVSILSLIIILRLFSFEWYFRGIEELKLLAQRTVLSKIVSLVLMFILVKKSEDYLRYALLLVVSDFIITIINIVIIYKKNFFKDIKNQIKEIEIISHFRKILPFFIILVFTGLYKQIDVIVLGINVGVKEVSYFSVSKRLITIFLSISTALMYVLIPKATLYLKEKKKNDYERLTADTLGVIYLIAIPAVMGVSILSSEIITLLFGIEYLSSSYLLKIMSILIFISGMNLFISLYILIPNMKENIASKITIIIGITNLILNIYLIPKYTSKGAAFSLIISEIVALFIYIYISKKIIKVRYVNLELFKYLFSAVVMYFILMYVKEMIHFDNIIEILILTIIGVFIYSITLFFLKEKTMVGLIKRRKC